MSRLNAYISKFKYIKKKTLYNDTFCIKNDIQVNPFFDFLKAYFSLDGKEKIYREFQLTLKVKNGSKVNFFHLYLNS